MDIGHASFIKPLQSCMSHHCVCDSLPQEQIKQKALLD